MKLTSPDKIVFTEPETTKQDVANYYELVADRVLHYIKNRRLSVVRCPGGVDGNCHYRKNPDADTDSDIITVSTVLELLQHVQMNTIEFHMYGAPEIMVFDLDPDDDITLAKLRQGVKDLKSILDELNLTSFLKTSGGKGYHIVVPFSNAAEGLFASFAVQVAQLMEAKWPTRYTVNIRKEARKGKIFVDYMRNSKGATFIAPYSLRAKNGAAISCPIEWEELSKIRPDDITIKNIKGRLETSVTWKEFSKVRSKQKLIKTQ